MFGKIGLAGLGAKVIFDGVVGGVSALIGPAIDAQKVTAQLESVLASTGGKAGMTRESIEALSGSLSKVTMFEDEAITSAQSLLLTFTSIGADVFPAATQTVLNMSQALGQDLSSSSMQLGKALNDPIAGIGALRRVGVQLTDQQEEQIKTMMAVGDIAGAQGVILAELETQFGGAAVAAGETFGGQLVILQNAFGDVMEVIGGPVLAGLSSLLTAVLPLVIQFGAALPGAIDTLMGVLGPIVGFISGNLRPIVAAATAAFVTWAAVTLTTLIPAFIAWAAAASAAAVATVIALAPVVLPIAAIGAAVFLLTKAWDSNFGDIQGKTEAVWGVLRPIFDFVVTYFADLGTDATTLGTLIAAAWTVISGAVTDAWDGIVKAIFDVIRTYFTDLGTDVTTLGTLASAAWTIISTAVSTAWDGIVKAIWDTILTYLTNLGTNLGALRDVFVAGWVLISTAVTTAWGIISPVFDLLGTGFGTITTTLNALGALFGAVWTGIGGAVDTAWKAISAAVTGGIDGLKTAMGNAGGALVSLLQGSFTRAIDAFRGVVAGKIADIAALLPHSLAKWGPLSVPTNWGDVLMGNLPEVADRVIGQVEDIASVLEDTLEPALDDAAGAADGLAESLSPLDGILGGLAGAVQRYGKALLEVPATVTTTIAAVVVPGISTTTTAGSTASSGSSGSGERRSDGTLREGGKPGETASEVKNYEDNARRAHEDNERRAGRAWGGPVFAGMPYTVGERGPELFVPTTNGTILPRGTGGGGYGGGQGIDYQELARCLARELAGVRLSVDITEVRDGLARLARRTA